MTATRNQLLENILKRAKSSDAEAWKRALSKNGNVDNATLSLDEAKELVKTVVSAKGQGSHHTVDKES